MNSTRSPQLIHSTGTLRPRLFSFASGLVVAFLIAILTSAAASDLAVGVADDNAFMTSNQRGHIAAKDLRMSHPNS